MKPVILVRYNEISLKKKNRQWYEEKLIQNIRQALRKEAINIGPIERRLGRIIIHKSGKLPILKRIFGIASYSHALETPIEIPKMADATLNQCELNQNVSFRVSCQRLDKTTELKSLEVEKQLGAEIVERTQAEVDLTEYDIEVRVELINKKAYIFTEKEECFGGLPADTQGTMLALIENQADVLAAMLMLKRGCTVFPIAYKETESMLTRYGAQGQRIIKEENEIDLIAEETKAKGLVVGQTLEQIKPVQTKMLVLRPLSGMTEEQIEKRLDEFRKA